MDYAMKLKVRNSIDRSAIISLLKRAVLEGRDPLYLQYIVDTLNAKVTEILNGNFIQSEDEEPSPPQKHDELLHH